MDDTVKLAHLLLAIHDLSTLQPPVAETLRRLGYTLAANRIDTLLTAFHEYTKEQP